MMMLGLGFFRRLFQLGRRFGVACPPHVRGVGPFVGLNVLEPPLAVAHGIKLGAF